MDKEKIMEGVRLLLEGIGEDVNREGLLETLERIARMCEEIYGGLNEDGDQHLKKQFTVDNSEMVLKRTLLFILPASTIYSPLWKSSCGLHTKQ